MHACPKTGQDPYFQNDVAITSKNTNSTPRINLY